MKLVFDTNIIHGDYHLRGTRIAKLCSASVKLGYKLMIPAVVFDEVVDQYRRELEKLWDSYMKMVSLVSNTKNDASAKEPDKTSFIASKVGEYKAFLARRLKELGIDTIPYPSVNIRELVAKEQLRKKPFKEIKEHGVGYRDALIWETVKSLCVVGGELIDERPQVEFLTENTMDFAGFDGSLHPDLVGELISQGYLNNSVRLVPNVQTFFETRIDVELEELESIKNALLEKGRYNRFNLGQILNMSLSQDYLDKELFDFDFDSGDPRFLPSYLEEPSISSMGTPVAKEVSVRKLEDDSVLIEVEAMLDLTIDFFVLNTDYYYYLENDKSVSVIDWNWNDYYFYAQRSSVVYAYLSFRTTRAIGKVLSSECRIADVRF